MRIVALALTIALSASPALAERMSAVGDNAYGCISMTALKQLRLMSAIRSAFEIALADKIERGVCTKIASGEALTKIGEEVLGSALAFKMRRQSGDELYVEARFVEPSI